MNFFLLYVSLPALLFGIMSKTPFAETQQSSVFDRTTLGTASAFVLAMIVGRLLGRSRSVKRRCGSCRRIRQYRLHGPGLALACSAPRPRRPPR